MRRAAFLVFCLGAALGRLEEARADEAVVFVRPGELREERYIAPLRRPPTGEARAVGAALPPAASSEAPTAAPPPFVTTIAPPPVPPVTEPEPTSPPVAPAPVPEAVPPPPQPFPSAPPSEPPPPVRFTPGEDFYRITGRLFLDGRPVAGAKVEVYERGTDFLDLDRLLYAGEILDRTFTGEDGRFATRRIPVDDLDGPFMGRSDPVLVVYGPDGPRVLFHRRDIRAGTHELGEVSLR